MREFKIEGDALKRDVRFRLLSWGTVLLLVAVAILLFVLRVSGYLSGGSDLGSLFVVAILGAVIIAMIVAPREALRRAEREMVFVLDDKSIVRKRHGYPEVKIAFSEVETLTEELRWLVITSTEPLRKIAVPNDVEGYELIHAELAKHHELSVQAKMPLKSFALPTLSVLSWAAVLFLSDLRIIIPAGTIAMVSLAVGSKRLWVFAHSGLHRAIVRAGLGLVWLSAILLIYFRVVRH